ncbi:GNAT family N-acetyltransferase [Curtobacterium sp. ZW137]|uniref:GNAT family N-acetyltransferase n=1 Tax=Curtobacterium sp. ZW137 TaxID=2485104 RepID=UPI000F4CA438|nr:GNAT family N-acetyltransferase [Curtobacterium sp. ZW137]ROP65875.1 ribosomal protein S18 acetylase RimI-like enzyme [Curtobacterium sp. ZW137]
MGKPDISGTAIRPATVGDAEGIARVHATSWRETYGRFVDDPDTNPWFSVERRIGMWRSNLDDPSIRTATAVATDGSGVVGFAAVEATDGPDAVRPEELTMLYVLARAHGSGAGQALLDAVLGERPASLWVADDNPRAHAFYRRNGFSADGATSSFGPIETTLRLVR